MALPKFSVVLPGYNTGEHLGGTIETARAERKCQIAFLLDELCDQAALVERLNAHRYLGPVIRLYRQRAPWYPTLDV